MKKSSIVFMILLGFTFIVACSRRIDTGGGHTDIKIGNSHYDNKANEVEGDKPYKKNAHIQIDEKGYLIKEQCTICHEVFPEPGAELKFVSPLKDICSKCHTPFDHPDVNHLVKIEDQDWLSNFQAYQKKYNILLPLDENGFITCTTCHNPHVKGVVKGLWGSGSDRFYLRGVSFEEACRPCHKC